MRAWFSCSRALLLLALISTALVVGGCATESENDSVRPWNSPMGWENGLPSNMTEGR